MTLQRRLEFWDADVCVIVNVLDKIDFSPRFGSELLVGASTNLLGLLCQ